MSNAALRTALFVISFAAIFNHINAQRQGYCLASDYEPYLQFGSKTSYEFVKGREGNQSPAIGCQPILFWSLNRHGTRLPGVTRLQNLLKLGRTRDDIVSNYEIKKTAPDEGRLCEQDLNNLKKWSWNRNFTVDRAGDLTIQGFDDLRYMAKRWQSRFPDLLPPQYSPRNYLFRHTEPRYSRDSFMAFIDGLFGRDGILNVQPQVTTSNDTLLMLNEFCTTWMNEVKNNPATKEQVEIFKKKQEYKNMIQNVSHHLGYRYELDENVVDDMYAMCRYDKAWEIHRNSAWCAAFNTEQLQLLEYIDDLKYYYQSGYGNPINKKLGCTPLKDMMDRFTKMVEHPEQDQPRAVVYFTRSKMLVPFLTNLGIGQDSVPLLADNYHLPNIKRRAWKTTQLSPFASNLAAVLHKCQNGPRNYQVMFYLNEKPVDFRDCQVGLCSWDLVKSKYAEMANQCNTKFCFKNSANAPSTFSSGVFLATIVAIVASKFI